MYANTVIKHRGVITNITPQSVVVRISDTTNCSSCQLKSSCGNVAENDLMVSIRNIYRDLQIDENVWVLMKKHLGFKAVFYAYIIPFILLVSVLYITHFWFQEWASGLLALGIVVVYYTVLYYSRSYMDGRFQMKIQKIDKNE